MKASELNEGVYEMLTSIGYARKVNNFDESTVTQFGGLTDEVKAAIKTFPVLDFDYSVDLMAIDTLDGDQQFYIFHNTALDGYFLVDTQGYNYPRYITRLWGFMNEDINDQIDDTFQRMDGSIRVADEHIFNSVVKNLVYNLREEGFDKEDIATFLDVLLTNAIGKSS